MTLPEYFAIMARMARFISWHASSPSRRRYEWAQANAIGLASR